VVIIVLSRTVIGHENCFGDTSASALACW